MIQTIVILKDMFGSAKFSIGGSGGTYNIDWGDRSPIQTVNFSNPNPITHSYNNQSVGPAHSITITTTGIIKRFDCTSNQITALHVRNCPDLQYLLCENNRLGSLDLGANQNLSVLNCKQNALKNLSVMHNHQLQQLDCASNGLNSLNLTWNKLLNHLDCSLNDIQTKELNELFKTLHNSNFQKQISISNNPGAASCTRLLAENKGWTFVQYF